MCVLAEDSGVRWSIIRNRWTDCPPGGVSMLDAVGIQCCQFGQGQRLLNIGSKTLPVYFHLIPSHSCAKLISGNETHTHTHSHALAHKPTVMMESFFFFFLCVNHYRNVKLCFKLCKIYCIVFVEALNIFKYQTAEQTELTFQAWVLYKLSSYSQMTVLNNFCHRQLYLCLIPGTKIPMPV